MVDNIGRRPHHARQIDQKIHPAHDIEQVDTREFFLFTLVQELLGGFLQNIRHGDGVHGLVVFVQAAHGPEDELVFQTVEVVEINLFAGQTHRFLVDHGRAENGLFGLLAEGLLAASGHAVVTVGRSSLAVVTGPAG